ncbi:5' DNA primase TraC [Legionella gratiana]|uniref:5' DNA primase TraC n=1 Tax=Legionella gratiana TaxID=45066 RepID=A0A378J8W6_9GAMM|nr:toprim domain-containing protein [Legionella gratiana]KTD14774.1 5' DNA primase TraC [Legionella gratiana]STX44212.1 5' DNA primase TraC [Legionella gratiana]
MDFNQIINQFQAEFSAKGITPPDEIIADGKLHRFHIEGDKFRSKNGWYVLYLDGVPCGVFGSWKQGVNFKWSAKNQSCMTKVELRNQMERIKEASKMRNAMKDKEQQEAACLAENLWEGYPKASPHHPYLKKKHISPYYARQFYQEIVLPVIDFDGKVWSLQYINELGEKRFLLNGAIKEHFMPVQHQPYHNQKILICEGFATGATLAEKYPTYCVIAACNAGNLKPVALHIRKNIPCAEITICADDDRMRSDNPGVIKAREAAIASGALFCKPKWPEGSPDSLKDFNDLYCWLADAEVQHA